MGGLVFEYQGQVEETIIVNKEQPKTKVWVQSLMEPTEVGKALALISTWKSPDVPAVKAAKVYPADIQVGSELLINLGNYENVKIIVRISVPVPVEKIDEAFGLACGWISDRMTLLEKHTRGDM